MPVLCVGCGKELPSRSSGPGRRAAYHGATCRQRARRARLTAEPDHAVMLAGLDHVEHTLTMARRAVTTGQDPRAALEQLGAAVTALNASGTAPEHSTVTKQVTLSTGTQDRTPAPADDEPADHQPRAVTPAEAIDPDTAHVVRGPDFEISGNYRVLATVPDGVVLVGILRRAGRAAWVAVTPALNTVSGGPWRTRQDALVHLLLHHDHARKTARHRQRPR